MARTFIAACVQNCATPDINADLHVLTRLIETAAERGAKLIALPEYCAGLATKDGDLFPVAPGEADHPVIPAMSKLARRHAAHILIGSIGVTRADGKVVNRALMIDGQGHVAARYDKIHLFDVDLGPGKIYHESATIAPGDEAVLAPTPIGTVGLTICYDLRFPHLYRGLAQAGAEILAVPAAFTRVTGEAHWHVLNRARAIENGAYVLAPCQYGTLAGGSQCYGHSLIVDPWGRILADGGDAEGVVTAEIDLDQVAATRRRIPSLRHDRPYAMQSRAEAAE